jgi:hypothetical protein
MACSVHWFKKIAAAWKAARKWGTMKKMNLSGEPKETAVSREIMPADGSNPASATNGDFGTSPLATDSLSPRAGAATTNPTYGVVKQIVGEQSQERR